MPFRSPQGEEDSNRLPRADYDARSRLSVAPAFVKLDSPRGGQQRRRSERVAPIPVQLSLFFL